MTDRALIYILECVLGLKTRLKDESIVVRVGVVLPLQAVASLLMGFKPDDVFEEPQLISQNIDYDGEPKPTWPYPPVLLLEAENDQDHYKQRIYKTIDYLDQQAQPLQPLFETLQTTFWVLSLRPASTAMQGE